MVVRVIGDSDFSQRIRSNKEGHPMSKQVSNIYSNDTFDGATLEEVHQQIDSVVDGITSLDNNYGTEAEKYLQFMEKYGIVTQRDSSRRSQMLKQSINKTQEEQGIGTLLAKLNDKCTDLDPSALNSPRAKFAEMAHRALPFIANPTQKLLSRFSTAEHMIDDIKNQLKSKQAQLSNDTSALQHDSTVMYQNNERLQRSIYAGQYLKDKLTNAVEERIEDDTMKRFMKDQLLFPLSQRIMDLQQQQAVNQQGISATAVIIRTNKDLIAGVDRAMNVTMSAMEIAVGLNLALRNQKSTIKDLNQINDTTNSIIAGIGDMLKENVENSNRQSASSGLDMDKLKTAMIASKQAINELIEYRSTALTSISQDISDWDKMLNSPDVNMLEHQMQNSSSNMRAFVRNPPTDSLLEIDSHD